MSRLTPQMATAAVLGVLGTLIGGLSVVLGLRDTWDENHGLSLAAGIRTPLMLVMIGVTLYAAARRWGGDARGWALTAVAGYTLTLWSWGGQTLFARSMLADGTESVGLATTATAWAIDLVIWTVVGLLGARIGDQAGARTRAARETFSWAR